MVAITNVLLVAITASATIVKRDFTTVQNDLTKINSDTQTLKSAIDNWDGTIAGSVPIQTDFNTVDKDINQTTADANALSARLSCPNTSTLINYIQNTLLPTVKSTIGSLIGKKPQVVSAGLQPTVQQDLNRLKIDENALGSALIAKACPASTASASSVQSAVASAIQSGINAYA